MIDNQNIDHLADELAATHAQLNEVRHRIRTSARRAAIAFVDLVGSTARKENEDPEHWLMEIYLFIKAVEAVAKASGGTIVKRLGDGALVSFQTVEEAEGFLAALDSSESFSQWSFRTAADYGDVYLFKHFQSFCNQMSLPAWRGSTSFFWSTGADRAVLSDAGPAGLKT